MSGLFPKLEAPDPSLAIRLGEAALNYRELAAASLAHAAHLESCGVEPGDPIAVWAQPAMATAVALVGNALLGAVSIPLNPKSGPGEVGHILAEAAPKLVLAAKPDAVESVAATQGIHMAGRRASGLAQPVDETPVLVLYTSGTTGPPKGAILTHQNVASNLDALARAWAWDEADTVVHALPLFHVHGLVLGLFGSLRSGGSLHWQPKFSPQAIAAGLTGKSVLFAVPTMYHRLADAATQDASVAAQVGKARLLISGSAPLPLRDHQRIEALSGSCVRERYGLTETLINCAVPSVGPPQPGRVGPPLEGVELRLVDDNRRPIGGRDDDTVAEIAVRGPNVFAGYLNRQEATAAVCDQEGWFYTGDMATEGADGSVRILGRRATDLIKTGGFKVGASEVEACLLGDPDVREVAVLGLPDADLGERIVAYIVPRDPSNPPATDTLIGQVADALAPHKRPREIHCVPALPRNAMGKVQKKLLQQQFAAAADSRSSSKTR